MSLFPALILLTAPAAYLPVGNGGQRAVIHGACAAAAGLVSGVADHQLHQVTSKRTAVAEHLEQIVA